MERPKNSRVRHGMPSCARYGCKRDECLEAERRAHREIHRSLRQGVQSRVSVEDAHLHAGLLVLAGMSPTDIADLSGVSVTHVKYVIQGSVERIHRDTQDAILGIPVPQDGWETRTDGLTDSTGTARRLRALAVQGFPLSALSERSGLTARTISEMRAGLRPQVFISNMRTVAELHEAIWDRDPLEDGIPQSSVTRAKDWAAKQKWHPTEAWDDIDDPECQPQKGTPRYVILTEDAHELMTGQGYTRQHAAERLGVSVSALNRAESYYRSKVAA